MMAARWYRKGEDMEHFERGFAGWFERRFARLNRIDNIVLDSLNVILGQCAFKQVHPLADSDVSHLPI